MASEQPARTRIEAIDFAKGVLVLLMVLYHWLNYFVGVELDYRYLRFLPPSFLFITGFLVTHVYLPKHEHLGGAISTRLFVRGIKLLALLIALNIGKGLVSPVMHANASAQTIELAEFFSAMTLGPALSGKKAIVFYVLAPIACVLLLSSVLVPLSARVKHLFGSTFAGLALGILLLGAFGVRSLTLEYVTVGFLGAMIGGVPIRALDYVVARVGALSLAYAGYLVTITIWNTPFPLLAAGVCLTVGLIYILAVRVDSRRYECVIVLGQYSLLGYISQIAILQVLSVAFKNQVSKESVVVALLPVTVAATMLTVALTDTLRRRSAAVDRLYRATFA